MASVSVRRGGSVRDVTAALVDSSSGVIPIASEFLSYVSLRGCSPNTVLAYAYDLAHLWRFFEADGLSWDQLTPQRSAIGDTVLVDGTPEPMLLPGDADDDLIEVPSDSLAKQSRWADVQRTGCWALNERTQSPCNAGSLIGPHSLLTRYFQIAASVLRKSL